MPSSASASWSSCRPTTARHVYHLYRRALSRARPDRRGARRRRHRARLVLQHAASPPACAALSRLAAGISARDRARRPREPRAAACGRGSTPSRRSVSSKRCAEPWPWESRRDQPAPHLAARSPTPASSSPRGTSRFACASTRRGSRRTTRRCSGVRCRSSLVVQLAIFVLFGFYNRWWRYVSTRDMWTAVRGVSVACLVSSLVVYFASPVEQIRLPRSIAIMDWLLLLAFVAGSRMLARTILERPSTKGIVARGRGGDRRRRGRRCAGDRQGDAEVTGARHDADRARRRRPAQAEPPRARRPCARHDERSCPHPPRAASRRGADRDAVRDRRDAPAGGRRGPRGRASP